MNTKFTCIFVVASLLVAIALGIAYLFSGVNPLQQTFRASNAVSKATRSSIVSKASLPRLFPSNVWTLSDHASWRLHVESRLSESPLDGGLAGLTILETLLHMRVLDVGPKGVTLAALCSKACYTSSGERIPGYEQLLTTYPVELHMGLDGQILGISVSPHVSVADRQALLLAYGWEFVTRPTAEYIVEELSPADGDNIFVASYARQASGKVVKSRAILKAQDPTSSRQEITHSHFDGIIGHLWLQHMEGSESSTLHVGDSNFAAISISIMMDEMSGEPIPVALTEASRGKNSSMKLIPIASSETAIPVSDVAESLRQQLMQERWAGVTIDQIMGDLIGVAGRSMAEVAQPLSNMIEWLSANPGQVPMVVESLRLSSDPEITGMVLHALSSSGTPAAIDALAEVLEDCNRFPKIAAIQAAAAAGELGDSANPRIVAALSTTATSEIEEGGYNISDVSLLALSRIAIGNVPLRNSLREAQSQNLTADAHQQDKITALMVFANARIDDPKAESMIKDPVPAVRQGAADYIGHFPLSPSREETLIQVLQSDPDPHVRSSVVTVLGQINEPSQRVRDALKAAK